MNGTIGTATSLLPAAAFLLPFAAGAVVMAGRRFPRAWVMGLAAGATALTLLLAVAMAAQGITVARRTITKYRKAMNIPSSRQRRDWSAFGGKPPEDAGEDDE